MKDRVKAYAVDAAVIIMVLATIAACLPLVVIVVPAMYIMSFVDKALLGRS